MIKDILKKIKFITLCALLIGMIGCTPRAYAKDHSEAKNVLIINSYHQNFTWSKDETEGIIETLMTDGSNISTLVEYMDWKQYPTQSNLNYLTQYFRYKYMNTKLDIIITTDDEALRFALDHRKTIFSNAPIVFCGVNQYGVEEYLKGHDRVTGAVELIDPTETVKIAYNINPKLKNIYLIHDNSESGISTGNIVTNKINTVYPNLKVIPCNDMVFQDLLKNVQHLSKDSIVLISTYYSDVHKNILDIQYVTSNISKNSSVPVYHLFDFCMGNGAIGGAMLSGKLQGKNAAYLALRVLNGENINKIPVITPDCVITEFDYTQMLRFGIKIKSLPENSIIMNKPFSFFETYRRLVIGVLAAFLVLITFILILMLYTMKIRRMKKNLSEQNEELTQLYEELTATDEEMRQQYEEIIANNEKIRLGEEKIAFLAYHDALTGLPNKLSLYEKSIKVLKPQYAKVALLFIDIDNFKYINDTMGHVFGDQVIIKVSERLSSLLEKNDTIYRHGGDEFIIMLEEVQDVKDVELFAAKILDSFTRDFDILHTMLRINLSFGIVIYPEHGNNIEQLLQYADIALYRAKEAGRKNYIMYNHNMNEAFTERANIEKYLQKALDCNEFEIYYQPQLDLKSNSISGFEALLRWNSPELGSVSPFKFISVAEDTHFIIPLGKWVLQNTCIFLKKLHGMGYTNLTASVNVSIIQLLEPDFYNQVNDIVKELSINPENLELEVTETVLIESYERVGPQLDKLHKMKVKIALDDFGKGYSSLYYLKQLPITTLKVDKTFIDDIIDINRETITGQIINFGRWMGMSVIAEGVEYKEQIDYLRRHECDKIQGYIFSKPIPEDEMIKLLEKYRL